MHQDHHERLRHQFTQFGENSFGSMSCDLPRYVRAGPSVRCGFQSTHQLHTRRWSSASTASRLIRSATGPSMPCSENPSSPNSSRTGSSSDIERRSTLRSKRPSKYLIWWQCDETIGVSEDAPARRYGPGRRARKRYPSPGEPVADRKRLPVRDDDDVRHSSSCAHKAPLIDIATPKTLLPKVIISVTRVL